MSAATWRRVLVAGATALLCLAPTVIPSAMAAAPATSRTSTDYAKAVKQLNTEVVKAMADAGVVGATIALVDGDRVILRRGYGFANEKAKKPVTIDTLFHIGSVSKTLTATAVMQLVERGLVDLDAPLVRYVPEFSLEPRYADNTITVRSVLDHHSGIPGDVFNGLITVKRPNPGYRDFLIRALGHMPPERRVDTEWAYNNSGYVLLQNLVEHVTGESFADYTREHLFSPMSMADTTYDDVHVPAGALTRNYSHRITDNGDILGPVREAPREYVNGWAAGSVVSSARDMTNYLRMLVSDGRGPAGPVLSPDGLRQMRTAQTHLPIDLQQDTGLSWSLTSGAITGVGPAIYHDGSTAYNFSSVAVLPDTRLAVFVSTNTVGGMDVASEIANRALVLAYEAKTGHSSAPLVSLPDTSRPATPAELQAVAGRYATSTGYDLVNIGEGTLLWTHNAQAVDPDAPGSTVAMLPTLDGWWVSADAPDLQVGFQTLGGKRLMLVRVGGAPAYRYYVVGQFAVVQPVNNLWKSRYGTYRAVNRQPDSAPLLVPKQIVIAEADGMVVMDRQGLGTTVLRPLSTDRAYSFGVGVDVGRGKGDLVAFDGLDFVYMGVRYTRMSRTGH